MARRTAREHTVGAGEVWAARARARLVIFFLSPLFTSLNFTVGVAATLITWTPVPGAAPGQLQTLRTFVEQINKWELEMTACGCLYNYENTHGNFKYMTASNLLKCKISNV